MYISCSKNNHKSAQCKAEQYFYNNMGYEKQLEGSIGGTILSSSFFSQPILL